METLEFYTSKGVDEILKSLQSSRHGLNENEALTRQQKFGKNEIPGKELAWYDIFFRQFKSPFLYLLIFAALLALVLSEWIDGLMIILFVLINSALGFYQEFRSEEALKILKRYISSKTTVYRDKEKKLIDQADLVCGDIINLSPGDKVPADLRLIETTDLLIDESILTGESAPIKKLPDSQNIALSGTRVVSGKGAGVVFRIGKDTAIGEISRLTVETKHESSFEKGIAQFSSFILKVIVLTLIFVFVANIFIKGPKANFVRLAIFSIALAVSVIPEALPIVTTFSLARGALKLAKNKVVVKKLSAIEDLGGIEILCTDKTGTLTENKLTLDQIYPSGNNRVLFQAAIASSEDLRKDFQLNSFDQAIWKALTDGDKKDVVNFEKVSEIPFDPERKRNSVLTKKDGSHLLIVRGAPEELVKVSNNLNSSDKENIHNWFIKKGTQGRRVIAIATKTLKNPDETRLLKEEENLEFIGCISFVDPIKSSAYQAIKKAERLGVAIKILTGDSREVAAAVAQEVGLIADSQNVISGDEFISLPSEERHRAVENYQVFARVSPQQKYKIIELLEEKHEVGFLGEGINDAPALKIANVALVVDTASDIARETADIVLLHKSLRVIVDGITLGRETFSNTTKYIKATLASNFGNFYTVAVASLLVNYLPLLPLQILLINFLTDFPMIAIAADTTDPNELTNPKIYDLKEIAFLTTILGIVSSFFDFMFFVLFSRISPSTLQTNWFIGSVLTELVFLFSIRSKSFVLKSTKPANIIFFFSICAALVAVFLPLTLFGQQFFGFISPTTGQFATIFSLVALYFITTEAVKLLYYRSAYYQKTLNPKNIS